MKSEPQLQKSIMKVTCCIKQSLSGLCKIQSGYSNELKVYSSKAVDFHSSDQLVRRKHQQHWGYTLSITKMFRQSCFLKSDQILSGFLASILHEFDHKCSHVVSSGKSCQPMCSSGPTCRTIVSFKTLTNAETIYWMERDRRNETKLLFHFPQQLKPFKTLSNTRNKECDILSSLK